MIETTLEKYFGEPQRFRILVNARIQNHFLRPTILQLHNILNKLDHEKKTKKKVKKEKRKTHSFFKAVV